MRSAIETLRISHPASACSLFLAIRAGLTTFYGDDSPLEDVLQSADQALYQAKSAGRNQVKELLET